MGSMGKSLHAGGLIFGVVVAMNIFSHSVTSAPLAQTARSAKEVKTAHYQIQQPVRPQLKHPVGRRAIGSVQTAEVVVVDAESPWLVPVVTSSLSAIRSSTTRPLLLVANGELTAQADELIRKIADTDWIAIGGPSVPARVRAEVRDYELPAPKAIVEVDVTRPLEESLRLAKTFRPRCTKVVAACMGDWPAVLQGGVLAVQTRQPLILVDTRADGDEASKTIARAGIREVTFVKGRAELGSNWLGDLAKHTTVRSMNCEQAAGKAIDRIGREDVKTIILTRVPVQDLINAEQPDPDAWEDEIAGQTAWLAPYVSLVRHAPVVLATNENAQAAENAVMRLIANHKLKPRTVTLLAGYTSIGTKQVTIARQAPDDDYFFDVDPCMPGSVHETAVVGVGRIPFSRIEDASALLARGYARKRLIGETPRRMLMVANPSQGLPLCETVSRATAAEFRNRRIDVSEYYGVRADQAEVLSSAENANMIVFEGHSNHNFLFRDEDIIELDDPDEEDDHEFESDAYEDGPLDHPYHRGPILPPPDPRYGSEGIHASLDLFAQILAGPVLTIPASPSQETEPDEDIPPATVRKRLRGVPVVCLQSCNSLNEDNFSDIFEQGGVALLGSVTPIHSSSGSGFLKVVCDGVLRRKTVIGESVRDARNCMLCVHDLKVQRGHKQMAKGARVGLSFCLWGDPELRVFPQPPRTVRRDYPSANWTEPTRLQVSLPRRRLDEARTDSYFVRAFAGSQMAGLVRRRPDSDVRRISPMHFFRIEVPAGTDPTRFASLARPDDEPNRTVFRTDPLNRFVYVVHLPKKERAKEAYVLDFAR